MTDRDNTLPYIDQFREFITHTNPISDNSWKKLCTIMEFRKFEKGVRLLDYMQVENSLRFVGKGIVKCEDHYNEKSFVYDFRVAPIILAETVSLLNGTRSRITLETVTECELIELPRIAFMEIMSSSLDITRFGAFGIVNYLGMTHYKQALLRTLNAEERYKQFLKEFPSVALEVKLEDIASYIGVTQQSLSRIRKNIIWEEGEKELEYLSNELEVVHGKNATIF
ncbi:Crp/Fnr family transcriptional regulator [Draconibacterium sp. IB214405]|uniref:Crp/Fnr family transcriptional regulator n=1 Tax=Draconibacterium sp. IB214405 TaxID=3097352 RepID=UPI002A16511E|nr:Crp/Fnr family transcriptional regulator [Draconibacterium sp. IB214405]MDX8340884.1 Crp/Fnr family transcriptional regulator [Draconibacterium sp. IB214405]